ncbi:MAG: helix-hairpin-helix domain-containing protein [Myxococcota bacterium]|nr:helix-hairpin-helix domain-containing protein [Myxococcota bacterium]
MTTGALFLLSIACNKGPADAIQLDWNAGETFYVAATSRAVNVKTEESPASLDGSRDSAFGAQWNDELVWTYQVVESGLVPTESDELYEYALSSSGEVESLAVLRAYLDESLNSDAGMLDSDPVVYLVFREDRDRLAAVISFVNVDGERVETAYDTTDLGKSYSTLSQSQLTAAPTYLAPFTASWEDDSRVLEDGSYLDSIKVDAGVVDVHFDDEISGDLVTTRYEDGQPWPTATVTENLEARLMTADEVAAKRAERPYMLPEAPEDFDYRAALASSIDIDSVLTLDQETIDGGWDSGVYEEFQPWAGSWWPLSKGSLVFGYKDNSWSDPRPTYSQRIKDDVDPIKKEMDKLSEEIREADDESVKTEKREAYQAKQQELVKILIDFYSELQADLDGGRITLANGEMTHVDGWSYELDELSPMDKYALLMWADNTLPGNNPFYLSAWEILNSYNPAGGSWWGHCNGWAAAAILTDEPRDAVSVDLKGQSVEFTTADLKGLLTEAHYSTNSRFYGKRYYKEGDDITDLSPAAFHKLITFYLKEQRIPLVFDTTASEAVWNFPAYDASVVVQETTDPGMASRINVNTADGETLQVLDGIGPAYAERIIEHREWYGPFQSLDDMTAVRGIGSATVEGFRDQATVEAFQRTFDVVVEVTLTSDGVDETHLDGSTPESFTETWGYTLVTDADGRVVSGTWDDENKHPDFAWVPYNNPSSAGNGSSENPFLPYGSFKDQVIDLDRH